MMVRDERLDDGAAIRGVVREAFATADHTNGREWKIVEALREAGALSLSLVAADGDEIVGHVAVSPVTVGGAPDWHGLGPVAVHPRQQRKGIGSALVSEALHRLRRAGAAGCVVLGDPAFYGRFGFSRDPGICYADIPPPYFQVVDFGAGRPAGRVHYHPAFEA